MLSKCIIRQCSSRNRVVVASTFTTSISSNINIASNIILTNSSSRNKLSFSLASQPLPMYHHHHHVASSMYGRRGFSSTTKEENDINGEHDATSAAEKVEGEPINPEEVVASSDPNTKIEQLEKDLKDMKDKVLRALAEEENVRRIAKRDIDNAKAYANEKFAKALLEVADNFDYAIAAGNQGGGVDGGAATDPMDNRTGADSSTVLKNLVEGVEATNKGLLKVFAQFGIVKYGAVGEKFDPTIHDALFQVPSDEMEPNMIAQLLKPGYKMKDRVLRAAQVGTSKKSA